MRLFRPKNTTAIDLTWSLTETSTIYPGDGCVSISPESTIREHGFATDKLSFCNHTSTHIDYPSHFHLGAKTSSDFPLGDMLSVPTLILDFSDDETKRISISDIINKTKDIDCNRFRALLLKTQNSQMDLSSADYAEEYVALKTEACHFICEKFLNLAFVGIDYLSIEGPENENFPVHKKFLDVNICILTGLNLSKLTLSECKLSICPLKLENANGAPVRCFAIPGRTNCCHQIMSMAGLIGGKK
jgi:arylformamidase